MPELPEVQTVVDTLRPSLLGRLITDVALNRQDILTPPEIDLPERLTGRTIVDIDRRGKRIIFSLDSAEKFYIHLGMSGRLNLQSSAEAVAPHTHLVIQFKGEISADDTQLGHRLPKSELRFADPRRFGGIWWLGTENAADQHMGPEPLQTSPRQLAKRLARTTRAIKNALLDQTVLAGLGNIYVDESLFAAGIHPLAPANTLLPDQIARLSRAIKSTLRRAIRHRGSTLRDYRDADGLPGGFQKLHRVYDCESKPCRTCRTPIERFILGGRSTHFCPNCQRLP